MKAGFMKASARSQKVQAATSGDGIRRRKSPWAAQCVTTAESRGGILDAPVLAPGVYRAEVWLEIGGEWRPWIYGNPIYLRDKNWKQ